jgi:hypothetical protein
MPVMSQMRGGEKLKSKNSPASLTTSYLALAQLRKRLDVPKGRPIIGFRRVKSLARKLAIDGWFVSRSLSYFSQQKAQPKVVGHPGNKYL